MRQSMWGGKRGGGCHRTCCGMASSRRAFVRRRKNGRSAACIDSTAPASRRFHARNALSHACCTAPAAAVPPAAPLAAPPAAPPAEPPSRPPHAFCPPSTKLMRWPKVQGSPCSIGVPETAHRCTAATRRTVLPAAYEPGAFCTSSSTTRQNSRYLSGDGRESSS